MKIAELSKNQPSDAWEKYETYRKMLWDKKEGGAAPDLVAGQTAESPESKRVNATGECRTCAERQYQDGSNDPGVSFQTPTKIAPEQAASAVRGHEMEHVGREQDKARREGRRVIAQSVTYHNAICPGCGRTYVAGGTTRTTTRGETEQIKPPETESKGFEAYA